VLALGLVLALHRVPLYGVETDLIGEYIPAARELRAGHPTAAHYATKGFGYPLLLAAAGAAAGGDDFLGAQILNVAAAVAGAACTWWFARMLAGELAGLLVTLLLVLLPAHTRSVFEAGTDQPAFALAMAATCLVLRPGGWRSRLAAGSIAGFAVITRYNMGFLLPAAVIALARSRDPLRSYVAYAAGAVLPIGAWLVTNAVLSGSPFTNTNYMNVAMALYGGTRQWSPQVAESFHSLGDVLRFDPMRAASAIGRQLVTNLGRDLGQLVPIWIGVGAVAGALMRARRIVSRPEVVVHWGLSYLTLGWVFYEPRFALYHAPFYLLAAVTLVLHVPLSARVRAAAHHELTPPRAARIAVIALLAIAVGAASARAVHGRLFGAPFETRTAGKLLAADAPHGGRVMAGKPHVAYYAGMSYLPIPTAGSLAELLQVARRERAGWLYFSQFEMGARPELAFLGEPGVRLPGLEPVAFQRLQEGRFFALYRLTGDSVAAGQLAGPTLEAQLRRVRERPDDARAIADLGATLIHEGRARDAIAVLERGGQIAPDDPLLPSLESFARYEVGDYDGAAVAAQRAQRLSPRSWAVLLQLGRVRIKQHRAAEGVDLLRTASDRNPANADILVSLGTAQLATGDVVAAQSSFRRALSITADDTGLRGDLARMLADAGHVDRALALIDAAPATQRAPGSDLAGLAASLRARR